MDPTLLVSIAVVLVILIISLSFLSRRKSDESKTACEVQGPAVRGQPVRRAAGVRNARRRMRGDVAPQAERDVANVSDEESNDEATERVEFPDNKVGAKKRAKLEAKAEKKAHREAAEREREDRRKREQLLQEERDKLTEKERAEEQRQEEIERKEREEKAKREYEEYLKMKEAFSVEEEGYDECDEEEQKNLLQEFLAYIKRNKVVVLEDLAAHFGLRTVNVIERIQDLQTEGNLTGVIDDRGKFIYISHDELEAVAKFVRQRGRVSITELAENSNRLINLNSGNDCRNTVEAR
ncbi:DDRGK domain-containing protein 1 [Cephus cinctus]|uniref:DDRGK domain-containing protein 1 n=1 Tax=Cephus cinctus TaxID=211228 RepID=A0AAJ7C390_CEPCN|nr:DDRGK domain-containing protein 1 [Cephus cinctus]